MKPSSSVGAVYEFVDPFLLTSNVNDFSSINSPLSSVSLMPYWRSQRGQVFILAIESDSFLSRNRIRFLSVINMGSLALPPDVTW